MANTEQDWSVVVDRLVNFARAVKKVKEGADTEGSAITLTHEECQGLLTGISVLRHGTTGGLVP